MPHFLTTLTIGKRFTGALKKVKLSLTHYVIPKRYEGEQNKAAESLAGQWFIMCSFISNRYQQTASLLERKLKEIRGK